MAKNSASVFGSVGAQLWSYGKEQPALQPGKHMILRIKQVADIDYYLELCALSSRGGAL